MRALQVQCRLDWWGQLPLLISLRMLFLLREHNVKESHGQELNRGQRLMCVAHKHVLEAPNPFPRHMRERAADQVGGWETQSPFS